MIPFYVENKLISNMTWLNTSFETIVLKIAQLDTLCLYDKIFLQNLNLVFHKRRSKNENIVVIGAFNLTHVYYDISNIVASFNLMSLKHIHTCFKSFNCINLIFDNKRELFQKSSNVWSWSTSSFVNLNLREKRI